MYTFQHSFQKVKSCVTRLIEVFYDIGHALDRGLESDIIYMDFAKAFDSVRPAKLVLKLKTFGIEDPARLVLLIPNWKASKSGYKWNFQ